MKLPIADCFKEYYKQHDKSFTDSERATIFWQSLLPLSDKLAALREIMETTANAELKTQIQNRLVMEEKTIEAFMSHDSRHIHLVTLDDSDSIYGIFNSIDAAVSYGKENCNRTFHIRKELPDDAVVSDTDKNLLLYGNAELKNDGAILHCKCQFSEDPSFIFINAIEATGFEEAYIPVLNPFEYGDIVRIIGDTRPAILMVSRKWWDESCERQKKSKFPQNYYSNSTTVEFLYPDGTFSHGHPDIFTLEKIEHWDDEEEWKLLQSISTLMKGNGCTEEMFRYYEANKYDKS